MVSLRARLVYAIIAMLLATLAAGALLTYWHALRKVRIELDAALAHGAESVAEAASAIAKTAAPEPDFERLVQTFNRNRHLRALLARKDGTVLESRPQAAENDAPEWFVALLGQPARRIAVSLGAPLDRTGHLFLETDAKNEIGEVWEDVQLNLAILAIFCALVLGGVYGMLGRALRPLDALRDGFDQIGGGRYAARVRETGPPELARMCAGFNRMAGRLGEMEGRNRRLHEQLAAVQEEERAELARDLHDEVSPRLFSVDVDAMTIARLAPASGDPRIAERAEAIRVSAAEMKTHIKSILGRLKPAVLLDLGLGPAVDQIVASCRARHPRVAFDVDAPDDGWGPDINAAIHYVVRESLNNALLHACPSSIRVTIRQTPDQTVVARIEDDGGGLRPRRAEAGFGLTSMKERIARAGGRLTVDNRDGPRGVAVEARIPLPAAGEAASGDPVHLEENAA